ncbi:MAG: glycosyltransferase family 4 protein [Rhizobiaceae bacterium]
MRVIIDMDSTNRALTGIGWYTLHLARYLPLTDENLELWAWRQGRIRLLNETDSPAPGNLPNSLHTKPAFKLDLPALVRVQKCLQRARQSRILRSHGDAIFHGTNFDVPRHSGKTVCTVHDMSLYRFPEHHPRQRVAQITDSIEYAARQADHLIAVSEFTKREMQEILNIPETRISVTHLAARADYYQRNSSQTATVLDRFGLQHGDYAIHVGTIEPRKNIDMLLHAYEGLEQSLRHRFPLVLAGSPGWLSGAIHDKLDKYQSEGWVKYLGYVDESDLPFLYAGARVFVFPSLYEGFGLPLLEAMSSGVPVLASSIGSTIEIAGNAAALFDPNDPQALRDELQVVLPDNALREKMISKGLRRAAQFSWLKTASDTYQVYQDIAR